MPANETSVPRLSPRSSAFRVFPGGTGVSSPASDRMRSELFTLINFRIGRSAKLERRRALSYYPHAQAEGYRRSSANASSICGSLAVLHGSFCDRSRRGREFQERSARFVEFTVVSASEEDVPRL